MKMHILSIRFRVPPQKHGDALKILKLNRGPTSVKAGCLSFEYYQNLEDGSMILMEQNWESSEDIAAYFRSDSFKQILLAAETAMEEPLIQIHEVTKTSGMELVEKAMNA
jgi:quinol monooxygenase YgiN